MVLERDESFDVQIVSNDPNLRRIGGTENVTPIKWTRHYINGDAKKIDFRSDAIVLDYDITPLYGESWSEDETGEIWEKTDSLNSDVLQYLKLGGTVICLTGKPYPPTGIDGGIFDWITELNSVEFVESEPVSIEEAHVSRSINRYLKFVDVSTFILDYSVGEIQMEPLALVRDGEGVLGAAIQQYRDPVGHRRSYEGVLILLPRPENVGPANTAIIGCLRDIAEEFSPRGFSPDQTDLYQFSKQADNAEDNLELLLDEELVERCLPEFQRGEYKDSVFHACRILDARVSKFAPDDLDGLHGTELMIESFKSEGGPLRMSNDNSEQTGVMYLYAGAIQGIRNVFGHNPDGGEFLGALDREQAREILFFIDFLLGLLSEYLGDE